MNKPGEQSKVIQIPAPNIHLAFTSKHKKDLIYFLIGYRPYWLVVCYFKSDQS